jgi:hypothetical protein
MAITMSPDAEERPWTGVTSVLVAASLAALIIGRAAFHFLSGPLPDETYYWLWGQKPALSYYDHPPLQAWLQGVSAALFGNTLFGLRAPALLTTAWMVLVLAWWARRAQRLGAPIPLALMLAVFFASPVIVVYSTIAFHDHLLVALVSTAAVAFTIAFEDMIRNGRVNTAALYGAGLAIGLAGLTKYNAAMFGLGAAVAIVATPRLRPLLKSPHLYAAAALALLCISPVLLWNLQNEAESFRFNLVDRFSEAYTPAAVAEHITTFAMLSLASFSLFAAVGLARCIIGGEEPAWATGWRPLAIATFAVPTAAFLALTLFTPVFFYWNIVAYLAFLPYAAFYMGRRLVAAHLAVGMMVALLYPVNYAVLPLSALFGRTDAESALTYGWSEVAARVEQERAARGAEFLLASDYRTGAILAFKTGDTDVEVISARRSQFDLWFDEALRKGQDALILSDTRFPLAKLHRRRFKSIEPVAELPVVRFGRTLKTYSLHLGRGYIPRRNRSRPPK